MRTLIGGVGYRNLGDLSFGPLVSDQLALRSWSEGVEVEDLSYGPVAIMHSLDERPPFDRMILIAGVARGDQAGNIRRYLWHGELPDREEVQARVVEAVTGVISLENLLVVTTWFRKLPPDVTILEIEPQNEEFGEFLSDVLEAKIPDVVAEVEQLVERSDRDFPLYDYIIPLAVDRPRGWVVRSAES